MLDLAVKLKDTPLPVILTVAGLVFVVLAITRGVPNLRLLPGKEPAALAMGLLLLACAMALYLVPKPGDEEVAERFSRAKRALTERLDGVAGLQTRLSAIDALEDIGQDHPEFLKQSIKRLIDYVREEAPKRRIAGIGSVEDRGTFRVEDVIAALAALQELRRSDPLERIDLTGVDLSRYDLTGADLESFDFSHADLHGAFLSGCNLSKSVFRYCNLRGIASWNSDFAGSDFAGADLSEAKLQNPDLTSTNIEMASGIEHIRQFAGAKGLKDAQKSVLEQD